MLVTGSRLLISCHLFFKMAKNHEKFIFFLLLWVGVACSNCYISLVENSSHLLEQSGKHHPRSRPTHLTHQHQCLRCLSHQKQQLYCVSFSSSITCHYLVQYSTRCGPIVQWLCSLPLSYPSVSSPRLCSFSISTDQLDSSRSFQSFTRRLYLCSLPSTPITISADSSYDSSSPLLLVFLQVLQLWPWWKSVVITCRDLSKCKWWQVEAGKWEWAHRSPNEPCLKGPTKSIG